MLSGCRRLQHEDLQLHKKSIRDENVVTSEYFYYITLIASAKKKCTALINSQHLEIETIDLQIRNQWKKMANTVEYNTIIDNTWSIVLFA
jgi:hypothetical protein